MSQNKHSAIPVFAALLAILATAGLVGVLGESSATLAESAGINLNQDVIDIELDHLSVSMGRFESFSLEKLPQIVRSLENRRIRIRGYMVPSLIKTDQETGITTFHFNGETRTSIVDAVEWLTVSTVHYRMPVSLRAGHAAEYRVEPFILEGTLRIEPQIRNCMLTYLFRIDDATMKPTKPRDGFHPAVDPFC